MEFVTDGDERRWSAALDVGVIVVPDEPLMAVPRSSTGCWGRRARGSAAQRRVRVDGGM
ncbi:MAG: hypothetical protein IRY85_20700 [Micromonosporaceae bacterium]|nr:hypothetical protein [Micromonosporaceae bacterium]